MSGLTVISPLEASSSRVVSPEDEPVESRPRQRDRRVGAVVGAPDDVAERAVGEPQQRPVRLVSVNTQFSVMSVPPAFAPFSRTPR